MQAVCEALAREGSFDLKTPPGPLLREYEAISSSLEAKGIDREVIGYLAVKELASRRRSTETLLDESMVAGLKSNFIVRILEGIKLSETFKETIIAFLAALKYRLSLTPHYYVGLCSHEALGIDYAQRCLKFAFIRPNGECFDEEKGVSALLSKSVQKVKKKKPAHIPSVDLSVFERYQHEFGHAIFALLGMWSHESKASFNTYVYPAIKANSFIHDMFMTDAVGDSTKRLESFWTNQTETLQISGLLFCTKRPSLVIVNRLSDATCRIRQGKLMRWFHSYCVKNACTLKESQYLRLFPSEDTVKVFLWLHGLDEKAASEYLVKYCK